MAKWMIEKYRAGHSKIRCPQCGRKSFTRYVLTEEYNAGNIVYAGDEFGICDHKNSCGYHLYPKKGARPSTPIARPEEKPPQYYDMGIVEQTCGNPFHNTLAQYLIGTGKFDSTKLLQLFCLYKVGSTKDYKTVFWQIDHQGRVHRGKVMGYKPDGHRLKYKDQEGKEVADVSSVRVKLKRPMDIEPQACYFGQHLYKADATIGLVESEKTALIAAYVYPQITWMATGTLNCFKSSYLMFAKSNPIVIFPDVDGYDKWEEEAQKLIERGFKITVNDFVLNGKNKEDIADILLNIMQSAT